MLNYLELNTNKTDEAKRNILFREKSYNLSSDIIRRSFQSHAQEIYLREINISGYKLKRAIVLNTHDVDDMKMVYDSYVNLYGIGDDLQEAVNEFVSMLIDLFKELSEEEPYLSERLRTQFNYLKSIINNY